MLCFKRDKHSKAQRQRVKKEKKKRMAHDYKIKKKNHKPFLRGSHAAEDTSN